MDLPCRDIPFSFPKDRAFFFSALPVELVSIIRSYMTPSIALFCVRNNGLDESLVFQPLDMDAPQRIIDFPTRQTVRRCGQFCASTWNTHLAVTTHHSRDPTVAPVTQYDFDTCLETVPLWSTDLSQCTSGASAFLDSSVVILPLRSNSYACVNTESGRMFPTSLDFGPRNPKMGIVTMAARNDVISGMVLVPGQGCSMMYYSGWTDTSQELGIPELMDHPHVTMAHCLPGTSTFVVGYGKRVFLYDFRESMHPCMRTTAPHATWMSSTMMTEHQLVSWNSLSRLPCGKIINARHFESVDLRQPGAWCTQGWQTPADRMSMWAIRTPRSPM